jgi:hypothetical protein
MIQSDIMKLAVRMTESNASGSVQGKIAISCMVMQKMRTKQAVRRERKAVERVPMGRPVEKVIGIHTKRVAMARALAKVVQLLMLRRRKANSRKSSATKLALSLQRPHQRVGTIRSLRLEQMYQIPPRVGRKEAATMQEQQRMQLQRKRRLGHPPRLLRSWSRLPNWMCLAQAWKCKLIPNRLQIMSRIQNIHQAS